MLQVQKKLRADRIFKDGIERGIKALETEIVQFLPDRVRDEVLARLQATEIGAEFRRSLKTFKVNDEVVGLGCWPRRRRLPKGAMDRTVVKYYPGRKVDRRLLPVFWRSWLLSEAPPPPPGSRIVYDVVSRRDAQRIRVANLHFKRRLRGRMARIGFDIDKPAGIATADFDVGQTSLRLEFGIRGYGYRPHWRPALSKVDVLVKRHLREAQKMSPDDVQHRFDRDASPAEVEEFRKFAKLVERV